MSWPSGDLSKSVSSRDVHGWAFDPSRQDAHLQIVAVLNGNECAWGVADQGRYDLLAAGIAGGDHGFSLSLPTAIDDAQIVDLEIVARSDQDRLSLPRLQANPEVPGMKDQIGLCLSPT